MKNLAAYIDQLLPFLSVFFALVGVLIFLTTCSSAAEYASEKMDTPLQQKIRNLEVEDSKVTIQFTGKTSSEITPEMKKELESTGITIESTIQNIFTAKGTTTAIKEISLKEYIAYMELARTLDIK